MRTRVRFLGALLALLAFSAYFAEGVWAAMCPPGMAPDAPAAAEAEGKPHAGHAGMHRSVPEPSDSPEHSRSDTPPCPFIAVGAGSSCVAVSLPAQGTSLQALLPTAGPVALAPGSAHDLLLASTLFHPPRA